jgi:DNA-binding LacI/PurR family transcriptional regulator
MSGPYGNEHPVHPGRPARPSSNDVARHAGVSQKTVSRVMNGEPHVTEQVRLRVLKSAHELGYRRNNAARALLTGRTRRIGVVSLGTALHGPSSLLIAIERAARCTGYALSVVNTFEDEPEGIPSAIESLLEQGVDGIILSEPVDVGALPISVGVPVLTLGRFPGLSAPRVITTGVRGDVAAAAATQHLLDLGHRTVRHVAGPQRWWAARDRVDGWRGALTAAGAEVTPYLEGDWSPVSGYHAGRRLAEDPATTAVFVANDDMAIGVIRALAEAERTVPDDVSVVGFDDIPSAAFLTPPLTTVAQRFDALAARGLTRLLREIDTLADVPPEADQPLVRLIVRASTAAPPTRTRDRVPPAPPPP